MGRQNTNKTKLFQGGPSLVSQITRVSRRDGEQHFKAEVDRVLDAGAKVYSEALTLAYNISIKRYLANIVRRISKSKGAGGRYQESEQNFSGWRNLTNNYRREKFYFTRADVHEGSTVTKQTYPNQYFQGYRYLNKDLGLSTSRRLGKKSVGLKGDSLISFIQKMGQNSKNVRSIAHAFGGVRRGVFGSIFKKGVTTTKSYFKDATGKRITLREALASTPIRTKTGVLRTSESRVSYDGKSYGLRRASELGLVGNQVVYSVAARAINMVRSSQDGISLHLEQNPYGGIFSGHKDQATKLHSMATGQFINQHGRVRKAPIDPFKEEAIRLVGFGPTSGYLHDEIDKQIYEASQRTGNTRIQTAFGGLGVEIKGKRRGR